MQAKAKVDFNFYVGPRFHNKRREYELLVGHIKFTEHGAADHFCSHFFTEKERDGDSVSVKHVRSSDGNTLFQKLILFTIFHTREFFDDIDSDEVCKEAMGNEGALMDKQ